MQRDAHFTLLGSINYMKRLLVAILVALMLAPTTSAQADVPQITVMTRNLYLGADVGVAMELIPNLPAAAQFMWDQVKATDFNKRAPKLAAEVIAANPDVILCDEVTSALDTVVRGAILDLLADLRRDLGVAYLFISHDLSLVRSLCDDVLILRQGEVMEQGAAAQIFSQPRHAYTRDLMDAIALPEPDAGWLERGQTTAGA